MIDTALSLFSRFPIDEVTVLDIAGAADMTPAAVYYHFASKEQILLEGMQRFADELLQQARALVPTKGAPGAANGVHTMMTGLLAWTRRTRSPATVYFVSSVGINVVVEALRRDTRIELIELLQQAVRAGGRRVSVAESAVIAIGLVSLLETTAASNLSQDAVYRALGARRFNTEFETLISRVLGAPASAPV